MMWQRAPAEQDGVRPGKTILADLDRFRRLPAGGEIDGVGEELRTETADGGERADADARSAINQMPAADAGMRFHDQLGPPLRLMGEMPARSAGKSRDPVQLADDGVRAEMKQIDVLAKRQVTDARAFFQDEVARKNPGEPDSAGRMDRKAELLLEQRTAQTPGKEKRHQTKERFHAAAPSER